MADTFWMDDEVKVNWEESGLDTGRIFWEPDKPKLSKTLSFLDFQIKEYNFHNAQHPVTDTGSQCLYPLWRQNIVKIDFEPAKIQVSISLN